MNIFTSLFGGAPAQTTPPGTPSQVNQPGQPLPGTQAGAGTDPNGIVPTQPPAPLDSFKDVWQTPPNAASNQTGAVFGDVDPQKLLASAQKIDFAKVITPEQMSAITSGGEAAVKAFAESMNNVAQTVYAQSAFATTKIVDQALAKAQEANDARLPDLVKKLSVNDGLRNTNPLLSNPAVTPLVSALTEKLVAKNPNATPAEIQVQVNSYFDQLSLAFAPKTPEPATAKSEDWDKFFS